MTWCWTRASIYRRSVSQSMLMAVSTCQGGVMVNNCYNCMGMFACTFYNICSARNSHFVTNKSHFVSFEGKRNFTIDFGSITFLMKWTHWCLYRFITLVVLQRNAQIPTQRVHEGGRNLQRSSLPSPTTRWKEGRSYSPASRVLPDNITQKIRLNLFCEMTMFLIDTITSACSAWHCMVPHRKQRTEILQENWQPFLGRDILHESYF